MENEMQVVLARIEEKLDGIRDDIKDVRGDVKDHEERLRHVEKRLWNFSGALGLISSVSVSSALYILFMR